MANELTAVLTLPAEEAAPRLIGSHLVRQIGDQALVGRIVEAEAYDESDAASHSYGGERPTTSIMFGPAGFLYVYFTYGMHYCCNVVTGQVGEGSAVLIRALEPLQGEAVMQRHRHDRQGIELTNGPAKLCQALQIDKSWSGHDLTQSPLQLIIQPPLPQESLVQTTRIGISRAQDRPWRWYEAGNKYVSKP